MPLWAGIDIGSVSLKLVVIGNECEIRFESYCRTEGKPLAALRDMLLKGESRFGEFKGLAVTGSGRDFLSRLLGAAAKNEILAQARGAISLTPDVRTIIEIGGQDSKLIFVRPNSQNGGAEVIDYAMNEVCAAGTGSFLDQQASRLGIGIDELAGIAIKSSKPAYVAGRCAVFAKSDMMHFQQQGVPHEDILAGLCMALVRNFIGTVGRGRNFEPPINFQGGVASNRAVLLAFEHELELPPGSIRVPPYYKVTGAYGAALYARDASADKSFSINEILTAIDAQLFEGEDLLPGPSTAENRLAQLAPRPQDFCAEPALPPPKPGELPHDAFLGVDVGAASVKMALVDTSGEIMAAWYRLNQGDTVAGVKAGLREFGCEVDHRVRINGVAVTGSGRHFVGALIGADVVVNEITAQARASLRIDPEVDTLIEIGGQDSKYVCFDGGGITSFEMNKVCAAGTGSFLQEQSARLGFDVESDFERLAQKARYPSDLGTRCTVFMDSDIIHYQQNGCRREDLVAGLAYAVVNNYLEQVAGTRRIGNRIHFQGGVAGNAAVAAALSNILAKPVIVSPLHRVTGAYGAALSALEWSNKAGMKTRFRGFSADDINFNVNRYECGGCPNMCKISRLTVKPGVYVNFGGVCGKHEIEERKALYDITPDLFEERERLFYESAVEVPVHDIPVIGMPRALSFFDSYPLWSSFLHELGFRVELSTPTCPEILHRGMREAKSETCLPVKLCYGHVADLIARNIETVFIPTEIELQQGHGYNSRSFNCPYVQGSAYIMNAAFSGRTRIVTSPVYMSGDRENLVKAMNKIAKELGSPQERIRGAIEKGLQALARFDRVRIEAGRRALMKINTEKLVVMLGKPHHLFDEGQNMHIAKKLRKLGITAIPYDFLPLGEGKILEGLENVVWKNSQDVLRAASLAVKMGLPVITLTNFGCGPDSFTIQYLNDVLCGHPHLVIELDDHTADAGVMTRLEAFLDTSSLKRLRKREPAGASRVLMRRRRKGAPSIRPSEELRRTLEGRRLYFSHVCTGMSDILSAAMNANGINAQCLPPQDERVEELGRRHALGNECHPYIITLGDIVSLTRMPGFDPSRTALAMFNYDGSCRLSQCAMSHKLALQRMGMGEIPVIGPITGTRTEELTRLFGLKTMMAVWKGWMAAEVLQRHLYSIRPLERVKGEADAAHKRGLKLIVDVISQDSSMGFTFDRRFAEALRNAVHGIKSVPIHRDDERPRIGLLGEFFTALNSWVNADIVRQLESLGAVVKPHGYSVTNVLMYYHERYYAYERLRAGRKLSALYYDLRRRWIQHMADIIESEIDGEAGPYRMLHADEIDRNIEGIIHYDIDPLVTTYVARFFDYMRGGIDGICCPSILNCMLSNTMHSIFRPISDKNGGLPLFMVPFDGIKQTNMRTRLEAFIEQARARRIRKHIRTNQHAKLSL